MRASDPCERIVATACIAHKSLRICKRCRLVLLASCAGCRLPCQTQFRIGSREGRARRSRFRIYPFSLWTPSARSRKCYQIRQSSIRGRSVDTRSGGEARSRQKAVGSPRQKRTLKRKLVFPGMSRTTCVEDLKKKKVLETRCDRLDHRLYYRICKEALDVVMESDFPSESLESGVVINQRLLSESTTEKTKTRSVEPSTATTWYRCN
jgi:hypothetical protein